MQKTFSRNLNKVIRCLCVLLKELKLYWAPYVESKLENMYTAELFYRILTAVDKRHRRFDTAIFWLCKANNDHCPSASSVQSHFLLVFPESLSHSWLLQSLRSRIVLVWSGPGHEESLGAARGSSALASCHRLGQSLRQRMSLLLQRCSWDGVFW